MSDHAIVRLTIATDGRHTWLDQESHAHHTMAEAVAYYVTMLLSNSGMDVMESEDVQPGRLPGALDKAAFAHMQRLQFAQLDGAIGLYAALTGNDYTTVRAALRAADGAGTAT
jgi:hypothetical protein